MQGPYRGGSCQTGNQALRLSTGQLCRRGTASRIPGSRERHERPENPLQPRRSTAAAMLRAAYCNCSPKRRRNVGGRGHHGQAAASLVHSQRDRLRQVAVAGVAAGQAVRPGRCIGAPGLGRGYLLPVLHTSAAALIAVDTLFGVYVTHDNHAADTET